MTAIESYDNLIKALDRMRRQAGDALNPPEGESSEYLVNQVMDSAHEILDLAHEFKQSTSLQSTR
jgi:hypothetical protein